MTDIHSHIIWDVDDGAPTIDVSLEMLKIARESGTTDIVATPHMNGQFSFQPDLVRERIAELEAALPEGPRIHYGCEFHLSVDNLDSLTASPRTYTINGKQYLLLECPDHHVGRHAETILGQLLDSGIVPIIAHPERVPVLQRDPDRLASWVELGCLSQITALSIIGIFGRTAASTSEKFLGRGLAHIVASDAHDPNYRHTRLAEAYAVVRDKYGDETAESLFQNNPRCVVQGFAIAGGSQSFQVRRPRRWWSFWKSRAEAD